jgi:hypothetical protein
MRVLDLFASVAALWLVLRSVDVSASVALLPRVNALPLIGCGGPELRAFDANRWDPNQPRTTEPNHVHWPNRSE